MITEKRGKFIVKDDNGMNRKFRTRAEAEGYVSQKQTPFVENNKVFADKGGIAVATTDFETELLEDDTEEERLDI